jgi:hypothetical protein
MGQMAELIHGKLFKRNMDLEAEVASLRLELKGWQAATLEYDATHGSVVEVNTSTGAAEASVKVLDASAVTASDVSRMVDTHAQQVQYLNNCISEKDEIIQELRKVR